MGWFKKKSDPISERSQALNEEIAALEAQIKELHDREARPSPPTRSLAAKPVQTLPRLRSTVLPHAQAASSHAPGPRSGPPEPVFEELDQRRLQSPPEAASPEHYNELGVRKYDLASVWRRLKNNLRGPATSNPKLVNYLAAGSIQGLRPLRYEKRVARNRFVLLVVFLVLILLGMFAYLRR